MPQLTINIDSQDHPYTVSEMRRHLAHVLSQLNGSQPVKFSLRVNFEDYRPLHYIYPGVVIPDEVLKGVDPMFIHHGPLAAPENN